MNEGPKIWHKVVINAGFTLVFPLLLPEDFVRW
jgi:hypothetical protein